jgi:hypothetical protein
MDEIPERRPDVVILSHGAREALMALPRKLNWLRCYAYGSGFSRRRWLVRAIRRPIWRALVAMIERNSRLTAKLVWVAGLRPVQPDSELYRRTLESALAEFVDGLGAHVVLVTAYTWRNNYWPLFHHIRRRNDAVAAEAAARWPGRVSVLPLTERLAAADFHTDGAHLTHDGHGRGAAAVVWAHLHSVCTGARSAAEPWGSRPVA